jgi:hypothetical protein
MTTETAEDIALRSPDGITTHEMSEGWRMIICRHQDYYQAIYYHVDDSPKLRAACESDAVFFLEREKARRESEKARSEREKAKRG